MVGQAYEEPKNKFSHLLELRKEVVSFCHVHDYYCCL